MSLQSQNDCNQPHQVNKLRAAAGEAQDVGGCEGVDAVEVAVRERLRSLASQNNVDYPRRQHAIGVDIEILESEILAHRRDARIIET